MYRRNGMMGVRIMIVRSGRGDGRLVKNPEGTQLWDKAQDEVMSLNVVEMDDSHDDNDGVLWWHGMKAYLKMNGVGYMTR